MEGTGSWNEENIGIGSGNVGNQGGNVRIRVRICRMEEIKVGMREMEGDEASQGRIVWEIG